MKYLGLNYFLPLTCDGMPKGIPLNFKQILSILRCERSRVTSMKKLSEPNILSLTRLNESRSAVNIEKH